MAGNGNKALLSGATSGDIARRADPQGQAKRRDEMYQMVENAEKVDVDDVQRQVAARKASADKQGDPLQLQARGRGAEKSRRARSSRVEGLQRGRRTLDVLNARQQQAARIVRDSLLVLSGGMKAQDFTQVRVDGGPAGHNADSAAMGTLWADYNLRQWFAKARFGQAEIEVVLRIAGMEESITAVCLDFETDPTALGRSESSRETKAFVKRMFVNAMDALADVMFGKANQCAKPASPMTNAIRSWSKDGPNFSLEQTALGEREDLVRK